MLNEKQREENIKMLFSVLDIFIDKGFYNPCSIEDEIKKRFKKEGNCMDYLKIFYWLDKNRLIIAAHMSHVDFLITPSGFDLYYTIKDRYKF